jgi:hypothetical protein
MPPAEVDVRVLEDNEEDFSDRTDHFCHPEATIRCSIAASDVQATLAADPGSNRKFWLTLEATFKPWPSLPFVLNRSPWKVTASQGIPLIPVMWWDFLCRNLCSLLTISVLSEKGPSGTNQRYY